MRDEGKAIMALLSFLMLYGCDSPNLQQPQPNQEIRERIFFECLKALPAGPQQSKYNDWDEVVSECGSQAYYMSMNRKATP